MKNKKITKRLLSKHENPALRSTKMRTVHVNADIGANIATVPTFDILSYNSGSTGALDYLSAQGWYFDNYFRKINFGGSIIGFISDKTVNINGIPTPFPRETPCENVKKYHPKLLCDDDKGKDGYYIVKSGSGFVTTDEWIFANALVTFSQVEEYLGVTFNQNIRNNLPLMYSKYTVTPNVPCNIDGCRSYGVMSLNVKKSDMISDTYDLRLQLSYQDYQNIIDERTFMLQQRRVEILNFEPYYFNDRINVRYDDSGRFRFYLDADKQNFIKMFENETFGPFNYQTLAWHYKLNANKEYFGLEDRYNKDLIVKEGLLTDPLLCRVDANDYIIYIVIANALKFEGVD